MIGQTNQTVEVERQREAEMFKLFEFLTGGAANEANAYPNDKCQRQQTYFYRGTTMTQHQKAQELAKKYHTLLINNECNPRFAWNAAMVLFKREMQK